MYVLSVGVERGVGEAFATVLPEEAAVTQPDMVYLVARAFAVQSVPLFRRRLTLPGKDAKREQEVNGNKPKTKGKSAVGSIATETWHKLC